MKPARPRRVRSSVVVLAKLSALTLLLWRGLGTFLLKVVVRPGGPPVCKFSPRHRGDVGERLVVNPLGAAELPPPDRAMLEHLSSLRRFLLSVGQPTPRKNLALLPALARLLGAMGERPVILRVGGELNDDLAGAIRQYAELHELGRIQDAELAAAYQTAAVFVMPSRLEGFGLPVIEAMTAGCPVACARASSLPEVAGQAALLFDPSDPGEAATACNRLLRDEPLRQQLIEAGRNRAAAYTCAAHWQRLQQVYYRVA